MDNNYCLDWNILLPWVEESKNHEEINKLANKLNSTRLAVIYLYNKIPVNEKTINFAHDVVEYEEKMNQEYINNLLK